MAKDIETLHTIDLNHRQSVMTFLSFMQQNAAKVIMYKAHETIIGVIAIVTSHRNMEGR